MKNTSPIHNFPAQNDSEENLNQQEKFNRKTDLQTLFNNELQSMYFVEKWMLKYFPKMIKHASNFELIEAMHQQQLNTQNQIKRLEHLFDKLKATAVLSRCKTIESLTDEMDLLIHHSKFGLNRDACMLLTWHKIAHFELASYEILATYAEKLKKEDLQILLEQSLNEEKVALMRLMKIASAFPPVMV